MMDRSSESEFRANASATSATSSHSSPIDEQIEQSKRHWSQLTEFDSNSSDELAADNRAVFQDLLLHPQRRHFFKKFGYRLREDGRAVVRPREDGTLEVGEKFAEGGQAELFHLELERVLKVFKQGTSLRYLQSQWLHGMFHWWAEELKFQNRCKICDPLLHRFKCEASIGTLLEDGRFAFLMRREHQDLRSLIDSTSGSERGPFRCALGPFRKELEPHTTHFM